MSLVHSSYTFDMELASKHGLHIAIFIQNLIPFMRLNKDKPLFITNIHMLMEIYPCWNEEKIKNLLKTCLKRKLLLKREMFDSDDCANFILGLNV